MIGIFINKMNHIAGTVTKSTSFLEIYSLKKGVQKSVNKGYVAAYKEMNQTKQRASFKNIDLYKMTREKSKRK